MSDIDQLDALRIKIDALDEQLLTLINQRARLAQQVADVKIAAGETVSFYRPEREAAVLRRLMELNPGPVNAEDIARIYREIMSSCLALEKPLRVAYLGPEGTFTQQAVFRHFGQAVNTASLASIDAVFREVASSTSHYGLVPVENSTEGVVTHTLDSFLTYPQVQICGEAVLRIHHNLMSLVNDASELTELVSHPQSFAQCRGWLDRYLPNIPRTPVASNGEAARLAADNKHLGAIASEVAAGLYGLNFLERSIEDDPGNTTRFLVIGAHEVGVSGKDKTSLLLSTSNQSGALHQMLEPFARQHIGLTKIESRPSKQAAWDYVFFIDVAGHRDDANVAAALLELGQQQVVCKILGSYPAAVIGG